jgi:hypothetical protein
VRDKQISLNVRKSADRAGVILPELDFFFFFFFFLLLLLVCQLK